jgi:DNA-binding response OmpR family regulator
MGEQAGRQAMESGPEEGSPWRRHALTYRAAEIRILAGWIRAGVSGAVVGLPGVGRSNLLGFLCHRPEALRPYIDPQSLTVALVPVDLGDLPSNHLADLYRLILRAFYEMRAQLSPAAQLVVTPIYQENRTSTDAFLAQSAVRELLLHFQNSGSRVVLVIDRFDALCRLLTPDMVQALGALRDAFRDTLTYIVGVRHSLVYLEDLELAADIKRLLTTDVCYLRPPQEPDARAMIKHLTRISPTPPSEPAIQTMLTLTGGYPALLRALCRWWLLTPEPPPMEQWLSSLLTLPTLQQPLQNIWAGLTQEEQQVLTDLVRDTVTGQASPARFQQRVSVVLAELANKGICRQQGAGWILFGTLFAAYVAQVGGMSRGRIWFEPTTQMLYHGQQVLATLTPKEAQVLQFLVKQPGVRHSYTDLIVQVWSDEENYHGVSNDALFQVIKGLRRKIEPDPAQPVYVVNWRGRPEGGYVFFPEGRPA